MFDYNNIAEVKKEKIAGYLASRGCPYNCSYCSNKIIRKRMNISKYSDRFFSVEYVINELKEIKEKYGIKIFRFDDDILPINIEWFRKFITRYKQEINIPFYCNLRFNLITEEVLSLLKNAGCYQVLVGLESGNEKYRKEMMNRNISQKMILDKMKLINSYGLKLYTFNIIGGPEEKPEFILDTIKTNAIGNTYMVQIGIMNPYPGTDIYEYCKEHHLFSEEMETIQAIKNKYLSENMLLFYKNNFFKLMRFYKKIYLFPIFPRKILLLLFDYIFSHKIILHLFPAMQLIASSYRKLRNLIKYRGQQIELKESIDGVGVNI